MIRATRQPFTPLALVAQRLDDDPYHPTRKAALGVDYDMKACPFCFGRRVRLNRYQSHGEHFQVICLDGQCNTRGPRRYDPQAALDAWNERGPREEHGK